MPNSVFRNNWRICTVGTPQRTALLILIVSAPLPLSPSSVDPTARVREGDDALSQLINLWCPVTVVADN